MVRRVNGVAVKIEGNPGSSMGGEGGLCAKGESGLQVLYDPNRLNVPLRRTNPEKGLFVDPKWKEISWEEAFNEILPRFKKIINENPKKLLIQFTIIRSPGNPGADMAFRHLFNQPPVSTGGGALHCGMGAHVVAGLVHASWSIVPDFQYCNYAIYFGANKGSGSGHSAMITTYLAAEARARGMRLIVFDPMCNFAGGKANEWVPILPGTDGAVA
ncbi:MAG: molybdopterin-dependent oxidoreductase, partial [Syntrophales bacterium]